jgi:glycogen operon protein
MAQGTNFALFSEVRTRWSCAWWTTADETGSELHRGGRVRLARLPARRRARPALRLPRARPYEPAKGHRCNPSKLLLDPYGKAVDGRVRWHESLFGYRFSDPARINKADSAPYMPTNVVINPFFDWGDDRPPRTPYHGTVIYEAHVRGLTLRHPDVPPEERGTYAGLAHPAVIEHLTRLGVTAVELMPVHQFVPEHELTERGLTNYWGYNTIAFLAPHNGYASADTPGGQVGEFKAMVKDLHAAGIEVILDVVYNHTAESDHRGPTLSFRGIDNAAYYRLSDDDQRYYVDYTGCGNSLNVRHPHALQLILDSLRYWILEMHVDGFRFDLAAALARELHDVDRLSAFFDLVQQDPVVSQVKLIAEPWDVGEGGYQVGNFPPLWSEWNGKYRDAVRDFWRGQPETLPEFASRLTGSSDLYETSGRRPVASINFVTCHDGFTLADLVSYDRKHNEANGEDNADGTDDNRSWNCGAEGPTDDPAIDALRGRQQRNFLATLLCSQGVPMLLAGDELGRTQRRQQQRLLPGQRGVLGGLAAWPTATRTARVRPRAGCLPPRAPGLPPPPFLPRRRRRRRPGRHRLAHPIRPGDGRRTGRRPTPAR